MFIDIIALAQHSKYLDTIAECTHCGSLWGMTEDEIQTFTNDKNDNIINGFVCPRCGQQLILPPFEEN